MLNKCAKFHGDTPRYGLNFIPTSAVELLEKANFIYNFEKKTLYKRATSVAHLTNFSFEFIMRFSQKMPVYLFYTPVQKSQNITKKKLKSRGPA